MKTDKPEIYCSTDIETDGPIPGPHSILSLASAAYWPDKTLVSTFTANLERLPDGVGDPKTMAWWSSQPTAWAAHRQDLVEPLQAMQKYVNWVRALPGTPVFVAFPAGFDFMFTYWYIMKFVGESPFSFSAIDIKTYAMAVLGCSYRNATKRNFPARWFDVGIPHTHIALDDAIEQGRLFCNILNERDILFSKIEVEDDVL